MEKKNGAGLVLNILLDVVVIAVIVLWAYYLYREFSQLPSGSENMKFTIFTIKSLLFSLFLIASVTCLFYINSISDKKNQPVAGTDRELHAKLNDVLEQLKNRPAAAAPDKDKKAEARPEEAAEDKTAKKLEPAAKILDAKDIQELFSDTVNTCGGILGAKKVSLFLLNSEKSRLVCVKKNGFYTGEQGNIETSEGLAWNAHVQGKRMFVTNIETHPGISRKNNPRYQTKSLMILPLKIFGEEKVGVLNMTEKEGENGIFSKSDLEVAGLIARMFEQKMENLVLYDTVDNLVKDKP